MAVPGLGEALHGAVADAHARDASHIEIVALAQPVVEVQAGSHDFARAAVHASGMDGPGVGVGDVVGAHGSSDEEVVPVAPPVNSDGC